MSDGQQSERYLRTGHHMTLFGEALFEFGIFCVVTALTGPFVLWAFRALMRMVGFGDLAPAIRALWGG